MIAALMILAAVDCPAADAVERRLNSMRASDAGQAADARRSFRAEDVEINQRVATPLSDGAWDGGSPAVAAIEEGTDALHGSRLVAEHCVDLVDEHGRVIAVDLPEQDRLGWTTDPPWVSRQGHAYDRVDPKRLRAADAP